MAAGCSATVGLRLVSDQPAISSENLLSRLLPRVTAPSSQRGLWWSCWVPGCLTLAKWETVSGQFGGYLSAMLHPYNS